MPFLTDLSERTVHLLRRNYPPVLHRDGPLLEQGELSTHVQIPLDGYVMYTHTSQLGDTTLLDILGRDEALGLEALTGRPQPASVVALNAMDVRLMKIPLLDFRRLREQRSDVDRAVVKTLTIRAARAEMRSALRQANISLAHQLAAHFLDLAAQFRPAVRGNRVELPLRLRGEDLGAFAGMSRKSVQRALKELRDAGLVEERSLVISDLEGLRRYAHPFHQLLPEPAPSARPGTRRPADRQPRPVHVTPAALPPDVPHFTGRRLELGELRDLLAPGAERPIVVIRGESGSGKSALATRFALDQGRRFRDGRVLVDLRVRDVPTLLGTILRGLGVSSEAMPRSEEELRSQYHRRVRGEDILLILDNARDVETVKRLLPPPGTCAVIVTSERSLPGLDATELELGPLTDDEARQLIAAISRSEAAPELAELCGNGPLALNVAAHALRRLTDQSPDEWGFGWSRGLGRGQEPIRLAFMLAYRSLTPELRRLFRFAALAEGPDLSVAATAALIDRTEERTAEMLAELTESGLMIQTGLDRYRQHTLLRLPGIERVQLENRAGTRRAAIGRLLEYYLTNAQHHGDVLGRRRRALHHDPDHLERPHGPQDLEAARRWFDRERRALVAAVGQAAAANRHEYAFGIADACFDHFELRRYHRDNIDIHKIGLRSAQIAGNKRAAAYMHRHLAVISQDTGENLEAIAFARMADDLFSELGDRRGRAKSLCHLGHIYGILGRHEAAIQCARESWRLATEIGDQRLAAAALVTLADSSFDLGQYQDAAAHAERALAVQTELDDPRGRAGVLILRSHLEYEQQRFPQAYEDAAEALRLSLALHDDSGTVAAKTMLARVCRALGRISEAHQHTGEALDLCLRIGDLYGEGWVRIGLAKVVLEQDEPDLRDAREQFATALSVHERIEHPLGQITARIGLGVVAFRTGHLHQARTVLEQAFSHARQIGDRRGQARALEQLSKVLHAFGQQEDAELFAREAEQTWQGLRHRRGVAFNLNGLARIAVAAGRLDQARESADAADEIRKELEDLGVHDTRARIEFAAGRPDAALMEIERALAEPAGDAFDQCAAHRFRGRILIAAQRLDEARAQLEEAAAEADRLGDLLGKAEAGALLGRVAHETGDDELAVVLLRQADELLVRVDVQRRRIPFLSLEARCRQALGDVQGAAWCEAQVEELERWLDPDGHDPDS